MRWEQRAALLAAGLVAALSFLRDGRRRGPPAELVVMRDGRVRYREGEGITFTGRLGEVHWHSRQLALVSIRLAFGAIVCLVPRFRQRPGEYRRLRVWLRHGIPEGRSDGAVRGP